MRVTVLRNGWGMLQGGRYEGVYRSVIANQQLSGFYSIAFGLNGSWLHCNRVFGGMKV